MTKTLCATKHMMSIIQPTPGRLATFNLNFFSAEPVTSLFNTGATCSCISFPLYNQVLDKVQIVGMQLWIGQSDSMTFNSYRNSNG